MRRMNKLRKNKFRNIFNVFVQSPFVVIIVASAMKNLTSATTVCDQKVEKKRKKILLRHFQLLALLSYEIVFFFFRFQFSTSHLFHRLIYDTNLKTISGKRKQRM